jgi:hypothetical protein
MANMANLKFQNMESAICDLKFRVLARTRCSRFAPSSLFNCGIRDYFFGKRANGDQVLCANDQQILRGERFRELQYLEQSSKGKQTVEKPDPRLFKTVQMRGAREIDPSAFAQDRLPIFSQVQSITPIFHHSSTPGV